MIVHPDFLDHWKTQKLIELASGDKTAPLMLIRLWGYCQRQRKSVFENCPNLQSICQSKESSETIKSWLIESGFLRLGDKNELIVHDFEHSNRAMRASWNNGTQGGRPPKPINIRKPVGSQQVSRGLATGFNKSTEAKLRAGFIKPTANPENTISDEERLVNQRKFAEQLKGFAAKLRSPTAESSEQENLHDRD